MKKVHKLFFFFLIYSSFIIGMQLTSLFNPSSLKELATRKVLEQMPLHKVFELTIASELKTYLLSIDDKKFSKYTNNVIKRVWDEKEKRFRLFVNGIMAERNPNESRLSEYYSAQEPLAFNMYGNGFLKDFLADFIDAYDNPINS